jgi:hypothetical protein
VAVAEFLGQPHFLAEGQAVGEPVGETEQPLEQPEQKTLEPEAVEPAEGQPEARRKQAVMVVPVLLFSHFQPKQS